MTKPKRLPGYSLADLKRLLPMAAKKTRQVRAQAKAAKKRPTRRQDERHRAEVLQEYATKLRGELRELHQALKERRRNPLAQGWSQATIRANIAKLVREGVANERASAAAFRSARAAWRKRHRASGFPPHLKPAKKKAAKRQRNPSNYKYVVSVKGGPRVARFLSYQMGHHYAQQLANTLRRPVRIDT